MNLLSSLALLPLHLRAPPISMFFYASLQKLVSHELLQSAVAYQAAFIMILLLLLIFYRSWQKSETSNLGLSNHPLVALQSFVTPKSSRWPMKYLNLLRRSCRTRSHVLLISLDALVADIVENRVELRDPCKHLQQILVRRQISLGHWKLKMFTENGMVSDLLSCLIRKKFDFSAISPVSRGSCFSNREEAKMCAIV